MQQVIRVTVLQDRQEEVPVLLCGLCGGELFLGEVYYDMEQVCVCRDCLGLFARRHFRHCRRQAGRPEVRL